MPAAGFTILSADVLAQVCERIVSGRTLRDVARDPDIPSHEAIYNAMRRDASVADAIARARRDGAHALAESVMDIADECDDPAKAQLARNRCEQRRWLAGKYNNQYADKQEHIHSGQVEHVLTVDATALTDVFARSLERRASKLIEHEPAATPTNAAPHTDK